MSIRKGMIVAALGVFTSGLAWAQTNEDPVLNLMVRKGLVTQAEADQARSEAKQELDNKPASSVFSLTNPSIQNLQFYGDGRLRFDSLAQNNNNPNSKNVQDRYRYRLRFGLDYIYSDKLKAGFELVSGTADDSNNQTMGATFTQAPISVGKVYLQYKPTDWATGVVGKFTNPWYTTTDMTYSFDLNPEGAAEIFDWTFPFGGGASAPVSDPKDAKDAKTLSPTYTSSGQALSVGLTLVQYDYITSNQSSAITQAGLIQNNSNVGIIGAQIPVQWNFTKDFDIKVVPGFTFYTSGGNTNYQGGVPTNYSNGGTPAGPVYAYGTANSSSDPVFLSPREADDLNIVSAPGEVDFKVDNIDVRPYWDFDWNVTGKQRVQNVYLEPGAAFTSPANGGTATNGYGSVLPSGATSTQAAINSQNKDLGDNIAWAAGLQIGKNKKKGDFSVLGEFRQIGLGSVDQNINGTDFANSYTNQEGVKAAAAYNFTDFLTATVTFYDTWNYKNNLYSDLSGKATGAPDAGTTQYLISQKSLQRVQVDLGWKF